MKKLFILNTIVFFILMPVFITSGGSELSAQNRYSIEKKEKKRKHRRSRQERYEDRQVKKAKKKQARLEKKRERQHKRDLRKYRRKVSGGGDELVNGKKVHKRMKKSRKKANEYNDRKKPFWKRWFTKDKKP